MKTKLADVLLLLEGLLVSVGALGAVVSIETDVADDKAARVLPAASATLFADKPIITVPSVVQVTVKVTDVPDVAETAVVVHDAVPED